MLKNILRLVDERKKKLDACRPLPADTVASIKSKLSLDWTYHSNAIEGNTLDIHETKAILEDGITIGGKSLKEHLEAVNHKDAIHLVEKMVSKAEAINTDNIKKIHYSVLKGIDEENAGFYRRNRVMVVGANFVPTNHVKIDREMNALEDWYKSQEAKELHPIERAAELHTRFVTIHPFIDGNGRTARLLLNLELMREGYPPAVIQKEERQNYYRSLDDAREIGKHDALARIVALRVAENLDLYLELATGNKQQPLLEPMKQQSTAQIHERADSTAIQADRANTVATGDSLLHQAENTASEQRALLENASLEQTLTATLKPYVEAKHSQIERIEARLGQVIEQQQNKMKQTKANPPKHKWLSSKKTKTANTDAWYTRINQQQKRLYDLEYRQSLIGKIKVGTDSRFPTIDQLATKKMRREHPELAASWDAMRESVRLKQQQERQQREKQAQQKEQSQGHSQGYSLSHRLRP